MKTLATLMSVLLSSSAWAAGSGCSKQSDGARCTPPPFASGYPTVVNGDGSIIGKAMAIGIAQGHKTQSMYADVRLEHDGHGYVLRFYGDNRISVADTGLSNADGYWVSPGCVGYPQYLGQRDAYSRKTLIRPGLEPFISSYFTVIDVYNTPSENEPGFTEASPFLAHIEPFTFGQMNLYGYTIEFPSRRTVCTEITVGSDRYTLYSLSDIVDIKSQFSAPITFVPD